MGIEGLIPVLIVLFVAALVKSVLGFGDALIAVPLLTLILGIQVTAPLVTLIGTLVTLLLVVRNRKTIDVRAIWQLTLIAMMGVPIGVWGLKNLPEKPITGGLGIVLILVGIYYLRRPQLAPVRGLRWTVLFGLASGIFGGAYNMSGAPMIIYGTLRQWQPSEFRGTLQSYFLIIGLTVLINHATAGLWTAQVWQLFVLSLPVIGLGFWIGTWLGDTLPREKFEQALYVALIVLGAVLILT